MSARMSETI
jgi:hypothetical protein